MPRGLGTCLTTTIRCSGLVISVLERDIKTQHVPERAVSWLVATGPYLKSDKWGGAWVAQLVEYPTLAQVMISRLVGSSPSLGSVLTAGSLEPASDSGAPSLCPSPTRVRSLSLSLSLKK